MGKKVVVIGCGLVGMSYVYSLVNQKTNVSELVLVDLDKERVMGEVMDLSHCLFFAFSRIDIRAGDYSDCGDADLVVITAGVKQKIGDTRMDLIEANSVIFKTIISSVVQSGFKGIFLVATNPVDVMTYLTWKYSSFDCNRVIGSGTSLDTARLRFLIGDRLKISPKNIHAYVMGEHGDSEFISWSGASIGTENVHEFLSDDELNNISNEVVNAAYSIINRKGSTSYGIGMCLVDITRAILGDHNSIITVSSYDLENDVYIGRPAIINKNGVREVIPITLTKEENDKFLKSVEIIKSAILKVK